MLLLKNFIFFHTYEQIHVVFYVGIHQNVLRKGSQKVKCILLVRIKKVVVDETLFQNVQVSLCEMHLNGKDFVEKKGSG